jgi:hypothetical protein
MGPRGNKKCARPFRRIIVPELATSFPDASGATAFARPFLTLRLRVTGQRSILQLGSGWANGAKLPKGAKGNGEKKPPLQEGAPPMAIYMLHGKGDIPHSVARALCSLGLLRDSQFAIHFSIVVLSIVLSIV